MRIDLHYGPQSLPDADRNNSSISLGTSPSRSEQKGQDQTQLSAAHVQVQALAAQVSQLPELRAEKVQALRQAVHSGNYRLDPEKTAAALVSHMALGPVA